MGRAFWATDFRELHEILLAALGLPARRRPFRLIRHEAAGPLI